ncbi:DNA-protecting protein DprA [Candidatus Nomurabacteria bacterium]|nr:DNA-protecting protein DprA [Candidatus Nomurabacteria bacterium]
MKKEVVFAHFSGYSHRRYLALMRVFDSLDTAFAAPKAAFVQTGWKQSAIDDFFEWKSKLEIDTLQKTLDNSDIHTLTLDNPLYPPLLKSIFDPPPVLFVRGNIKLLAKPLAIVGSRKTTSYGRHIATSFSEVIAPHMSIVSGLALGIDGIAHRGALQAQGHTVAVLAGGIDDATVAPHAHRKLAMQILDQGGALLTEFPPGCSPKNYTFPLRNRIIAGMSIGTLVIEAAEKSGALITANYALESGRDVFSIPHQLLSTTGMGCNNLIAEGAHVAVSPESILEYYNIKYTDRQKATSEPQNALETQILDLLSCEPLHVDQIFEKFPKERQKILPCLTVLEIKSKVKNLGNMTYARLS